VAENAENVLKNRQNPHSTTVGKSLKPVPFPRIFDRLSAHDIVPPPIEPRISGRIPSVRGIAQNVAKSGPLASWKIMKNGRNRGKIHENLAEGLRIYERLFDLQTCVSLPSWD
jgi:hypothetical protein